MVKVLGIIFNALNGSIWGKLAGAAICSAIAYAFKTIRDNTIRALVHPKGLKKKIDASMNKEVVA